MASTNKTQLKGALMLLLTAFIWGSSFVAQSVGMESVGAFTFSAVRMYLGALVVLPFLLIRSRKASRPIVDKKTMKAGVFVGIAFAAATNFQQFAFYYSTPGKIAFVTALYMFFVPVIGLALGKKVSSLRWISVILGLIGLYFLCITPGTNGEINRGDLLAICCSFFYAIQILLIDRYAGEVDGLGLSFSQLVVCGTISFVLMFVFENPSLPTLVDAAVPILYSGIFSCGAAYTFQIIGQKYTEPVVASLLMCMESVFAVLMSALILGQVPSDREFLGSAIMFAAILLSELSEPLTEKLTHKK